jgi:hypothetical protein
MADAMDDTLRDFLRDMGALFSYCRSTSVPEREHRSRADDPSQSPRIGKY